MYSEQFIDYLFRYQLDEQNPNQKEGKKCAKMSTAERYCELPILNVLKSAVKNSYMTVPINYENK